MRDARDFVSKMKLVLSELDEKLIEIILKTIRELEGLSKI